MRAALLNRWPDLSYWFHIRPWELGLLSPAELTRYLEAVDEIAQKAK